MYGIVTFTGDNTASFQNANNVFNSGNYAGILETVANIDLTNSTNTEIANTLNVNGDTTLFIKWTNPERTQFITVTRIVGFASLGAITTALDYILQNEDAINNADGNSQADILNGNGTTVNDSGGGFGFGNGGFDLPWWLFAAIAVMSGIKSSSAKKNTGKVAWGALGLYAGIQTAKIYNK